MLSTLLGCGPDQFGQLGQIKANLFLDDFAQGNVRRAEGGGVGDERSAESAGAGVELAHAARDEVDQDVGVANFFQGFSAKFCVHKY